MLIRAKQSFVALSLLVSTALSAPVQAAGAGDLLIAPTRIVMNGARGTEILLNNIGEKPATYRISVVLRKMLPDGAIQEVEEADATPIQKQTLSMISYAPRRVTLPPNQPQAIRIGVRAPAGLADGEYRAHILFRAIPDAKPVTADPAAPRQGLSISLTPIYGVAIPIIVRQGNLKATASLSDAKMESDAEGPRLFFKIARTGDRSTYGRIKVFKPGVALPIVDVRGLAVYTEIAQREVHLAVTPEQAKLLPGPATIKYLEDDDAGGGLIAELQTVIR
jgi:P pilus assembly chaperone PapD